ncbi:MAG: glycosyltransferase [Defluviitaleaceae bacterium]|nr:glycosyltransferase [Defluviitaleaceae bacterium]
MNILYLINYAGKGGSEKYVKLMAEYAKAQGGNIFFVYNETGLLVSQMEGITKNILCLNMKAPFDLKAAKSLAGYCTANKIDIIHTQFARENYIAILSKKLYANRTNIIHTCHINTPNNTLWRFMNKFFMNENFRTVAVCNSVRDLLIKNNYPADKVQLVYNGVYYRENFERPLKNSKPFAFVTLTRFSEEKGIFFLLESAKTLKERGFEFTLTIAGDGPLYEDAKKFVEQHNLLENISLPGYCDDTPSLLLNSDCFINSSSSEALSFAILEAMEGGLPIIATNVGGNPDIINEKTDCGILVPYGNRDKLANAMSHIIDNLENTLKMSKNARKAVKEIFNVDNSIKTAYNIYNEAVGR